ncbi:hypothetical protein H4Q26_006723, partial [Puccinia striiformis f. sp. tritici PST-130]
MEVESESESLDSSTDSNPDHPPSQIQDKTTKKLKKIEAVKLASIYDSMKQKGLGIYLSRIGRNQKGRPQKKENRKLWDDFILSSF